MKKLPIKILISLFGLVVILGSCKFYLQPENFTKPNQNVQTISNNPINNVPKPNNSMQALELFKEAQLEYQLYQLAKVDNNTKDNDCIDVQLLKVATLYEVAWKNYGKLNLKNTSEISEVKGDKIPEYIAADYVRFIANEERKLNAFTNWDYRYYCSQYCIGSHQNFKLYSTFQRPVLTFPQLKRGRTECID